MLEHLRHVAVATDKGAFMFRPRGPLTEWEMVGYGLYGRSVTHLAKGPESQILACLAEGMIVSTEDWVSWTNLYRGFSTCDVRSVLYRAESGLMFAGTCPAAVFLSEDLGETWQDLKSTVALSYKQGWTHPLPPHRPELFCLFGHSKDASTLIGGVQAGGVIVSRDNGRTWNNSKAGLSAQLNDLRYHPDCPSTIFACNFLGFYRSDDLGQTFRVLNHGLPYERINSICVHSINPERLLLAAVHPTEEHTVIFGSDDGGQSWELACSELPAEEKLTVTCLESGGGVFFAGTKEGFLFGSRDGVLWELIRAELPPIRNILWVGEVSTRRLPTVESQTVQPND